MDNLWALLHEPVRLVLLVAATWRMVSLICNEEGPFDIFGKNRRFFRRLHKRYAWFRATHLYSGVNCEWCVSIWVAFPFLALYLLYPEYVLVYATALTLSAGTILVKYIIQPLAAITKYYDQAAKVFDEPPPQVREESISELEDALIEAYSRLSEAERKTIEEAGNG